MKALMGLIFALLTLMSLSGCGDKASASAAASAYEPPPMVLPVPARKAHQYSMRDGQEYGYEGALSDEQRTQGRVMGEVKMFSYLGRKDDVYQVMLKADDVRAVIECAKPCEFVKAYTFAGDRFISKEVMKLTPDAILTAVLEDAMYGKLEPLRGQQKGKATSFWVDGPGKRLIVADAETSGVVK